jgi:hypothetical protein
MPQQNLVFLISDFVLVGYVMHVDVHCIEFLAHFIHICEKGLEMKKITFYVSPL